MAILSPHQKKKKKKIILPHFLSLFLKSSSEIGYKTITKNKLSIYQHFKLSMMKLHKKLYVLLLLKNVKKAAIKEAQKQGTANSATSSQCW